MQTVPRKEPPQRRPRFLWIIPAALLLAGSVTAMILLRTEQPASLPSAPTATPVPEDRSLVSGKDLLSVTITRRNEAPWTLVYDENGAHPEGEAWKAVRHANEIREAVTNIVYADVLAGNLPENPAEFGLDNPLITAEARYTDGTSVTIRIGDRTENWYYLTMDGDERLFTVSADLPEELDVEKQMLRQVTQPEIYAALLDRITVSGRSEWRLKGRITDQDAPSNWEISNPFRYPADEQRIKNLKTTAANLRMGIFQADATPENLAAYGLDRPDYTLELHMSAGSTGTVSTVGVYDVTDHPDRTVILDISRSENEMIDYVRFGDEIFSVSHLTLSALLDTDPADTAARYIAPVPLNSLESMTIDTEGEVSLCYTLDRSGTTAGEEVLSDADSTAAGTYTGEETADDGVRCFLNGEEISHTAFAAAYERLLTVTVTGTLPEKAAWQEPHTRYTFRTVTGTEHTLFLSSWDKMHDAVTLDGATRFYILQNSVVFDVR